MRTLRRLAEAVTKRKAGFETSKYWEHRHCTLDGSLRAVGNLGLTNAANASQYALKRESIERVLEKWSPQAHGKRLLDAGCGVGAFVETYLAAGFEVHGVDFSPTAVARARRRFPAANFRIASIESLSLNESFDVVVVVDVLLHIVDDNAWQRSLATLARHLNDEGRLVIVDTTGEHRTATARHVRIRPLDAWQDVFRRTGLQLLERTALELPLENVTKDVFVLGAS